MLMTQRKTPFRPRQRAEISQAYNDGVVTIYSVRDGAASGFLPEPTYTEIVTLCYQERKLGVKRYYDAKQNQIHAERVIRVPASSFAITNQNVAETEGGQMYRIDLVQVVPDVYPPSVDLTLAYYDQGVIHFVPPGPLGPDGPESPTEGVG